MTRFFMITCIIAVLAAQTNLGIAQVLFEDTFNGQLSSEWKAIGLAKDDYRIRNGALELRVQSGAESAKVPMLLLTLPSQNTENVIASVEVTLIDRFTVRGESAGLFLMDDKSREFGAQKTNINGHLVFSPGQVDFIGEPGTEGDPQQYTLKFWPARDDFGPLRIIVRSNHAYFQVGPSKTGENLNFFHSEVEPAGPKRGFCLSAYGAPADAEHWVRFDNFRVVRP